MPDSHYKKYTTGLFFGIAVVTSGIFILCYGCIKEAGGSNWYVWAAASSLLICLGLYLLMNAYVHKVKSDIRRKQKSNHHSEGQTA
ncbi:MAG TPA: hypothetical protein PLU37_05730 [Chitinophagaceae bacterium]|nr:hypothetical protein [Chitinophagaceae bacterium]MCB9055694.1 hypothetical protein [Chitinophagales bacterium]HPG11011.1 hypothetical protein [Chitinophagaceae bacterium]